MGVTSSPASQARTLRSTSFGLNGGTEVLKPVAMAEAPLIRMVGRTGQYVSHSTS